MTITKLMFGMLLLMVLVGCVLNTIDYSDKVDNLSRMDNYEKKECCFPVECGVDNPQDCDCIYPVYCEREDNSFMAANFTEISYAGEIPTLNMSFLRYKGEQVDWVYQKDVQIDKYTMQIVQCIMLTNGTRYCEQ